MQMCFSKLLLNQSLNRLALLLHLSPSLSSLSFCLRPSFSTFIFPSIQPCRHYFSLPHLLNLWQQTEESCPPLPSEVQDPLLRDGDASSVPECSRSPLSPSLFLCRYECRHDKLTRMLLPKAAAWQSDRNREILEGIYLERRAYRNIISKSINYSRLEPQTCLWSDTETKSQQLYFWMNWHCR